MQRLKQDTGFQKKNSPRLKRGFGFLYGYPVREFRAVIAILFNERGSDGTFTGGANILEKHARTTNLTSEAKLSEAQPPA
ncbi:MAG: hypothetical protein LBQ83_05940 [Candidatus Margulisbacteria bacterium]|jgi:hypothetical protein|nr:hypothetical protein [Candidatus Margulisiibacteriota bacterium]